MLNIDKAYDNGVKIISGVSTVLVEVQERFTECPRLEPTVHYCTVNFSEKEMKVIRPCHELSSIHYDFVNKCINNIVISKVRKSLDLSIGKSFQVNIVSIKVLN